MIFCSEFLEVTTKKRLPGFTHSALVRNGADEELFYPPAEKPQARETPVVLFAGRLIREKGVHVFTAAMRLLQERGVALEARIVGSSSFGRRQANAVCKRADRYCATQCEVQGILQRTQPRRRIPRRGFVLLPIRLAGALRHGQCGSDGLWLPVVATNVGGIPEAFREGGGLLVDPNSPEQLAEAISTLLRNEAARKEIAREGYQSFVKNFTWSAVRDQYQQVVATL